MEPSAIIAVGNTAAQTLLGTTLGITQLRVGPPKQSPDWLGVKIVATFHPAACLRAADFFPSFVTDIGKLQAQSEVEWQRPTYRVFDQLGQAVAALHELARLNVPLVVDIEVGIEKEIHFGHPEHYNMLCIGIGYAANKAVIFDETVCAIPEFKREFRKLLLASKWIAHNGKFDIAGLMSYAGTEEVPQLYFDTMLASYVLDERPGTHGLKYLATEFLGAPDYSADLSKYVGKNDSYALVPRDILYEYNACDVTCTFALYERYVEELSPKERELHDFMCLLSPALMLAEMEGILIDDEYNQHLTDTYLDSLGALRTELAPWVANPNSPKQVKEALHDMGIRVASTDEAHLTEILERVAPDSDANTFCRLMLIHRREAKLYGTYVKGIRKRIYRNRIHSVFLLHGTTTGRAASRNPNLFNIPRESSIREQFRPSPGNVFVQADYATIELRVMATEAKDPFLKKIFDEHRDIHNEFSLEFYGPSFTKDQRVRTKAFVYGLSYGRSAFSVAIEHGISLAEAEVFGNKMFAMMPEVRKWQNSIRHTVFKTDDDIETRFGRKRRFWLITEQNKKDVENQALAFIPQSTASDVCAHALRKLRMEHKLKTRISVYDSILVECPKCDADSVSTLMVATMENTATELMGDYVPFPVDIKIGNHWGEV